MSEGIAVFNNVVFYGAVIDGTQNAGIEGYGVGRGASTVMPGLVSLHYVGGEGVEHNVFILAKFPETIEGGYVSLGSTDFAVLLKFYYLRFHVVEEGVLIDMTVELFDDIVGGVRHPIVIEFADYFV